MQASPAAGGGIDGRDLRNLRAQASGDPRAAIQQAAKQFESIFMQELMKSMRSATLSSGMMENSGTQMGTELLDTQFANKLTGLPGGLSTLIAKQLERQLGGGLPATPHAAAGAPSAPPAGQVWNRLPGASRAQDFVARHSDAAAAAQAETGIPAAFVLSQAAHESGWGQREIRAADGSPSHNVFGIKAGNNWKGPVAEVATTEYIDGKPRKVMAKFRAYASHEEAFRDYARLIKDSPRYAKVVEQGGSAQGFAVNLQRAGYATDPEYAAKLGRVINTTLRLQRTLAT